jgi:hypothetical protein
MDDDLREVGREQEANITISRVRDTHIYSPVPFAPMIQSVSLD